MLYSGLVQPEGWPALVARVRAMEAERVTQAREKGAKGLQRTPAFVHGLVLAALAGAASASGAGAPRGGFTDVGLHTGGIPRDTCWPLVREVIKVRGVPRPSRNGPPKRRQRW